MPCLAHGPSVCGLEHLQQPAHSHNICRQVNNHWLILSGRTSNNHVTLLSGMLHTFLEAAFALAEADGMEASAHL